MKDMYSIHADQKDLDRYYEIVKQAYFKIFERLDLKDITYLTYASGGPFSKYSHEFQTVCQTGEDTIYICNNCQVAINKEIIKEQDRCPICGNKKFREEKAVEVANIFKLGTRFSKPFDLKYADKNGDLKDAIMGCYGMGPTRIMGTIVEVFHDKNGIIWPKSVAPFKVHLLSLNQDKEAEKIYQDLIKEGIEVLYDDRTEPSAGEKFAEADLIGLPIRLVVSDKTLKKNSVELKRRNKKEVRLIEKNKITEEVKTA